MFGSQKRNLNRLYKYDSMDIAVAFEVVARETYGKDSICSVKEKIIWDVPVEYLDIEVSFGKTQQGILGPVRIISSKLKAEFIVCPENSTVITCLVNSDNENEAKKFFDAIEERLKTKSIYRGKAITLNHGFLDISKVDAKDFIYNEQALSEIQTHIWTILEKTARCREEKIPLYRKVLLVGTFGAGKTFTAYLTAKKAAENGWTFFYMLPSNQADTRAMARLYDIARKYSPAVVFIEDIDHEQRSGDIYTLQRNLSEVDGLTSKTDEVITIMSANRAERIAGAMQRPGRIDKIIKMGILDAKDIERFVRKLIRPELLEETVDWGKFAEHCKGYPPAFLREISTNALLHMIGRNQQKIGTEFLIRAAEDLKDQFKACEQAMGFNKT